MLRERAAGERLWEAVLPAELRELPPELRTVDGILDDDRPGYRSPWETERLPEPRSRASRRPVLVPCGRLELDL
jgi:hypothetical protein